MFDSPAAIPPQSQGSTDFFTPIEIPFHDRPNQPGMSHAPIRRKKKSFFTLKKATVLDIIEAKRFNSYFPTSSPIL